MEKIEQFKAPVLPKMLGGAVMCVDAKAWNALIDYVTTQTKFINNVIDLLNKVNANELQHAEAITTLANIVKEHLEQ